MTAAVLRRHGGPDALEVRDDWPVPSVGPGQVLVRVGAAALNNTDIWTREGAYGLPGDPDAQAGWRGAIDFPLVQGGDIAGTVEAVAPTWTVRGSGAGCWSILRSTTARATTRCRSGCSAARRTGVSPRM
ncbi:alcohol dehydrogenase catalytic domain-containing protein [Actinomadura sp. CNU-125]|uniref:alcohol dehydrogenase catalytic domain-containing protein n=1 Tax=Actinomadura sp. CNU-125 TaxID=1904961 RepID=UPI0021CC9891|nr:alcohol dehydrogenase catalytic domain-containing protein [Actinomadura sp. CNU-125]